MPCLFDSSDSGSSDSSSDQDDMPRHNTATFGDAGVVETKGTTLSDEVASKIIRKADVTRHGKLMVSKRILTLSELGVLTYSDSNSRRGINKLFGKNGPANLQVMPNFKVMQRKAQENSQAPGSGIPRP